jgi:3-phenylpropionate/trans-cinnamate dioxygenase ferredoxin subunit
MERIIESESESTWIEVASTSDFEKTDRKLVDLGGDRQIGLFKRDGEFLAIGAWCSHERAMLFEGEVLDYEITCPLHGSRFDLRTGRQLNLPAVRPVPIYEVKREGDRIFIKV